MQQHRDAGFVIRSRKLTGGRFVETLVFSWLANPDATYTELAQTAGASARLSVVKRLNSVSPPKLQRL